MKKIVSNLKRFVKFGFVEIKPYDNIVEDEVLVELKKNKIFNHYISTKEFEVSEVESVEETKEIESKFEDFKTLTLDELKSKYSVDELKEICKTLNMRGYKDLLEDELIEKIITKVVA